MWNLIEVNEELKTAFFRCDCGTETTVKKDKIKRNLSRSCFRCRGADKRRGKYKYWKGYKIIPGSFWNRIVATAKKEKRYFSLTIEFIYSLLEKQDFKCALSGLDITFGFNHQATASLDRIDSNKDYTEDNVQWVHKLVNRMKSNIREDVFIHIAHKISKFKIDNFNGNINDFACKRNSVRDRILTKEEVESMNQLLR